MKKKETLSLKNTRAANKFQTEYLYKLKTISALQFFSPTKRKKYPNNEKLCSLRKIFFSARK